jgi:tocopherol O-methyltransferase
MSHEEKVRLFYDSAVHCYQTIMGHTWHHGDPDAEARGLSGLEACQQLEEKIVELTGLQAGGRALDFGSGVGGPTLHMAKVSRAQWVGVSNNEGLSQRARQRAAELGLEDQASFWTIGDNDYKTFLPFADGELDAVTFYESICHLPDKQAFFQSVFRILKPGGRLVGIDWVQRAFGEHQTEAQIMRFMQVVNETICIPWHGTIQNYASMMTAAGFEVTIVRDMFDGVKCWGSTPTEERPQWVNYDGPDSTRFRAGKAALDSAREAGVFSVGFFAATKPRSATHG